MWCALEDVISSLRMAHTCIYVVMWWASVAAGAELLFESDAVSLCPLATRGAKRFSNVFVPEDCIWVDFDEIPRLCPPFDCARLLYCIASKDTPYVIELCVAQEENRFCRFKLTEHLECRESHAPIGVLQHGKNRTKMWVDNFRFEPVHFLERCAADSPVVVFELLQCLSCLECLECLECLFCCVVVYNIPTWLLAFGVVDYPCLGLLRVGILCRMRMSV